MVRTHRPGQTVFRSILPEDIDWKPFPAFPPSVRLAIVVDLIASRRLHAASNKMGKSVQTRGFHWFDRKRRCVARLY